MPNSIFSSRQSGLQAAASKIREQRDEAAEMMENAAETAGEMYDDAAEWVSENKNVVYIGAAVLAVGFLGYLLIGRNSSRSRKLF